MGHTVSGVRYVFSGGLCVYCDPAQFAAGNRRSEDARLFKFYRAGGKSGVHAGFCAQVWLLGSHLDRTGHMDLHGDPTDRDGSRKPGIIWKTKIGAFYGALDMVSGNGSLLWSAVSMVFKSGEKAGL